MTQKEIAAAKANYYKEYDIDPRTLPMIVSHYISIGGQRTEQITDGEMDELRNKLETEEKEAEAKGNIMIMAPEFQIYLLQGCRGLAKLSPEVRNIIIKENL